MQKADIAKRMARQSKTSLAEAADCLDQIVSEIVAGLRKGHDAELPGLGKLTVQAGGGLRLDRGAAPHD